MKDYERTAVYLAKTPKVLRHIRSLLASHTLTSPLFNTKQTTEGIEAAYEAMHDVANRLHPLGRGPRFQLVVHPEHTAEAFGNAESFHARADEALKQGISPRSRGIMQALDTRTHAYLERVQETRTQSTCWAQSSTRLGSLSARWNTSRERWLRTRTCRGITPTWAWPTQQWRSLVWL